KDGLWLWCGTSLMVTPDGGKSWDKAALEGGGSCEAEYTIRAFVPASDGNYYVGSRNGVIRSKDGLKWTRVANTSGFAEGTDGGIPFLAFDDKHRILYASMFSGGVARMVVP
ncbi:MAG: hypothetical protein K0R38_3783, partial [Polyangiaceae bacterium]|nr:hypothetical protein [Polyangiaceae bacterium]